LGFTTNTFLPDFTNGLTILGQKWDAVTAGVKHFAEALTGQSLPGGGSIWDLISGLKPGQNANNLDVGQGTGVSHGARLTSPRASAPDAPPAPSGTTMSGGKVDPKYIGGTFQQNDPYTQQLLGQGFHLGRVVDAYGNTVSSAQPLQIQVTGDGPVTQAIARSMTLVGTHGPS
jgi:hypothetical protein